MRTRSEGWVQLGLRGIFRKNTEDSTPRHETGRPEQPTGPTAGPDTGTRETGRDGGDRGTGSRGPDGHGHEEHGPEEVRPPAEAETSVSASLARTVLPLVAVDPGARRVEVVTGPEVRRRLDDRAAALATMTMTSAFQAGDLAGGIATTKGTVEETFDNYHRIVAQRGDAKGRFTFSAADSGESFFTSRPQTWQKVCPILANRRRR